MDTSSAMGSRNQNFESQIVSNGPVIAVPFYRNEHLVDSFIDSLIRCAAEINELGARVLIIDDSPDYLALNSAIKSAIKKVGDAFSVSARQNLTNLGWLKTCNLAMQEADNAGADLFLFNSDTVIVPGALREMVRVSRLDPMIGFVNPRSNNATLATLPVGISPTTGFDEAVARYRRASNTMPDHTYVPTAVGFAVLIRNVILVEFGYFDEVYAGGYNEENDLVMRAARCGYRAVLANHAFVWHEGQASLGATSNSMSRMEVPNRRKLVSRYPEYPRLVNAWFSSPEYVSEQLVSALVPNANGRLTVAFDFSSFRNFHSGTYKAGMQFLRHAAIWKKKFDVVVLCSKAAYDFHNMASTGVTRADLDGPERYAAIFRVGQPFDWNSLYFTMSKGAVAGTFMLDTIALDCSHLYDPTAFDLWQHLINHADFTAYNSEFTASQFENRFENVRRKPHAVCLHSASIEDYRTADDLSSERVLGISEGYILVVGNQYPHKAVGDTASRIALAYPDKSVVALGATKERMDLEGAPRGESPPLGPQNARLADVPNLIGFNVGQLSDADMTSLHRKAAVVVMPSHYEGFGMPIFTALSMKKPILVRRTPPALEIQRKLDNDPNLHLFDSTNAMVVALKNLPPWQDSEMSSALLADGDRMASQILDLVEQCISQVTYAKILMRVRATQTVLTASSRNAVGSSIDHADDAESAAYRLGRAAERAVRPLLKIPAVYRTLRLLYRAAQRDKRQP